TGLPQPSKWEKDNWYQLTHFIAFSPEGELWCATELPGTFFKWPAATSPDPQYPHNEAVRTGEGASSCICLAFTTDRTIASIEHFEFLPDLGKIVSLEPQALATQKTFTNSSGQPHKYSFSVSKEITTTSTFSHDQSYTVSTKSEITFSAGIPSILETEWKISINRSTTRTWNFTETNTITTSFSATTDVTLAPNTSLCMQAFVTKGVMEIPYRARVRSYFGYEFTIEGVYKGATVFNLTVKQTDCKSLASTSASRAGLL
uniref:Aerolysin-like C-terminal domain-containing protein n=1 Tax=Leptobrachium leishanense TaxID=445787 RepID=A0A8C5QU88_9ANUR